MPKFFLKKLVRDFIVRDSEALGITVEYNHLENDEAISALFTKFQEESKELKVGMNTKDQIKELVDLQQIINSLCQKLHISKEEFEDFVEKKRQSKGGFEENIYVESMEMDVENPRCTYYRKEPERFPEVEK